MGFQLTHWLLLTDPQAVNTALFLVKGHVVSLTRKLPAPCLQSAQKSAIKTPAADFPVSSYFIMLEMNLRVTLSTAALTQGYV